MRKSLVFVIIAIVYDTEYMLLPLSTNYTNMLLCTAFALVVMACYEALQNVQTPGVGSRILERVWTVRHVGAGLEEYVAHA